MAATALSAVIVGAGPAGLATSHELARRGVDHLVLERGARVGHTWRHLYDSLVLHTGKHLSSLPGLPFPASTPLFPARADVVAYLDRYATTFDLPVRPSAEVIGVDRADAGWRVRTRDGIALSARTVVIATGIAANPWTPRLPGREASGVRVRHSIEYRRPDDIRGPRVLVAGGGNSAADIACELASAGLDVTLSVRSALRTLPLRIFGVPSQYAAFSLSLLPRRVQRTILGLGLRGPGPDRSTECFQVPVVGARLRDAIAAGTIRLAPALAALTHAGARFGDGLERPFDDVILATGFRPALGCLAGARVRLDACGFACRRRHVASADAPHLYFVGQNADVRGTLCSLRRDARLTARAIAKAAR